MLLDADLAALSANHASPLGEHVRDCARCRAIVVALQADTSRLAALTVAHPAPAAGLKRSDRRRPIWLAPIPLAAAAVVAYVALSRAPSSEAPPPEPIARQEAARDPAAAADPTAAPDPAAIADDPAPALSTAPVAPRVARRHALPVARPHPSADAPSAVVEGSRSTPTRIDVGGPTLAQSVAPTPVAYAAEFTTSELALADVSTVGGRVVVLRPSNSNITVVWCY
jgi:hypothetical protein